MYDLTYICSRLNGVFKKIRYHNVIEIIEKVREAPGTMGPFRPEVSQVECTAELRALLQHCWSESPDERPNLAEVFYSLKKMNV